jgi:hypothetical protein
VYITVDYTREQAAISQDFTVISPTLGLIVFFIASWLERGPSWLLCNKLSSFSDVILQKQLVDGESVYGLFWL